MNAPVNPPKPQAQKDQDDWVQIVDAAAKVIEKLSKTQGKTSGKN